MVFVKVDNTNEVFYIRYNFDYETTEIDLSEGMVFDAIPTDEPIEGKYSRLMYDDVENKLYYKYIDIIEPKDPTAERLDELEAALVELAALLGGGQ